MKLFMDRKIARQKNGKIERSKYNFRNMERQKYTKIKYKGVI